MIVIKRVNVGSATVLVMLASLMGCGFFKRAGVDFEPALASGCPNLAGVYQFKPAAPELALFERDGLGMTLLELSPSTSENMWTARLRPTESSFLQRVEQVRQGPADVYDNWRKTMAGSSSDPLRLIKLMELGPVPEIKQPLYGQQCNEGWLLLGVEAGNGFDTQTWLSVNHRRDLIVRTTRYETTGFLFGSTIRAGFDEHRYGRVRAQSPSLINWTVPTQFQRTVAETTELERARIRRALPDMLQSLQSELETVIPAPSVSHFALSAESLQATQSRDSPLSALWVEIDGTVTDSRALKALLAQLAEVPALETVELASVRHLPSAIEFNLRCKLKPSTASG